MKQIGVSIPEVDIIALDQLVRTHHYASRNDAIRYAIKDLLKRHRESPLDVMNEV